MGCHARNDATMLKASATSCIQNLQIPLYSSYIYIPHILILYLFMYLCVFGSLPDLPNEPQFEYCISYNNGQPALQVMSHVCTYTQLIYLIICAKIN